LKINKRNFSITQNKKASFSKLVFVKKIIFIPPLFMKKNPKVRKVKTLAYGKKSEIKIRGKIISISLVLEQKIEYAIYDAFMPRINERKIRKLYIEEFIKPIQFEKKVRLFNELLKTEFYQKKLKLLK